MTWTRASRTACCATILTALEPIPAKILPSSQHPSSGRPVATMRESFPGYGQQGLSAGQEALIFSGMKKDNTKHPQYQRCCTL